MSDTSPRRRCDAAFAISPTTGTDSLATSGTPAIRRRRRVLFFFDSALVGQLGFLTPDAQKVVSPSIVFDDLDGAARRIPWRVEETTGRVTEYMRHDDESENVLH